MGRMDIDGCGCPSTLGMGRVHHVFVNVSDLDRSRAFYDWLMPRLGYATGWGWDGGHGYLAPGGSFWIKQADARLGDAAFHKDRVGLCEIAFAADGRAQIDALTAALRERGVTIVHPPREYPEHLPGYYAVFFADPEGIKLELVHIPGFGATS
jgi:catechol 2,3-dioxygenase-like lactoylglutathione lyase family enzyme